MAETGEQVVVPLADAAEIEHNTVATWVTVLVAVMVTEPVGAPAATGETVTTGVKVTEVSWPTTTEDGVSVKVVVVVAGTTERVWAEETEPVKLESPE